MAAGASAAAPEAPDSTGELHTGESFAISSSDVGEGLDRYELTLSDDGLVGAHASEDTEEDADGDSESDSDSGAGSKQEPSHGPSAGGYVI